MTKKEMIDAILETFPKDRPQPTRIEVEMMFESFCDVAAAELIGGGEIYLQKLGKLKVRETSARKGHNPQTGEEMDIPAGKKVVFVPGKDFKEAMKADIDEQSQE
ncbi:MAG: HU family DNA-binding protein [Desulfovibrio sp.]|jgi:Bacterial nucleoid DNA-binding protein